MLVPQLSRFILHPLVPVRKGSGNREAQRREGPRGGACSSLGSRGPGPACVPKASGPWWSRGTQVVLSVVAEAGVGLTGSLGPSSMWR